MGSTFVGLSTALSGLTAANAGLDTTAQNVANANTPGYSRQQVSLASMGAPTGPAMYSSWQGPGDGVTVAGITRVTSAFAQAAANTAQGQAGLLAGNAATLAGVQSAFPEPSSTGIGASLSAFWSGWAQVANNPTDLASRSALLAQATGLTDQLHQASASLGTQWTGTRTQLVSAVGQVNTTASQIAGLNQQIQRATASGVPANELADQRDQLASQLATLTGASTRAGANGMVDVVLGGTPLVSGTTTMTLGIAGSATSLATAGSPSAPGGADPSLVWTAPNGAAIAPAQVSSGQLGSLVGTLTSTLPSWSAQLDAVAASLATTVNTIYATGQGLPSTPGGAGAPGGAFFTGSPSSPGYAATIGIGITSPAALAASSTGSATSSPTDGLVAQQLATLASSTTGPDATYHAFIGTLGATTAAANQQSGLATSVSQQAVAAVASVSGVSIDQEMVNMLRYQHAYEAAAKVMTTIDSTLSTLMQMG
ncbi:MAG: flagellar hook-associated protein FlgK [Actinomycetes bacterium]